MYTQQENSLNENTYILTPEKERQLKEMAREDYYLRQRSIIDRFRKAAMKATELAAIYEHTNPELAENAKSNAKEANFNADTLEWILKKEKEIDEKDDIIAEQTSALSEKENTIEEQSYIIQALKARLNAYGIPYTEQT